MPVKHTSRRRTFLVRTYLMLALTRVSAPLGIGGRVDAGGDDIFGINGMSIITIWDTFLKMMCTSNVISVGLCPAVFPLLKELVTSFKRITLINHRRNTDPTKRTTCRMTSPWVLVEFSS